MSFLDKKSMDGKTPIEQAELALFHLLKQINNHAEVGYYLGIGTQTYQLVTEAYASIKQQNVREVRDYFAPINPRNPYAIETEEDRS